MLPTMHNPLITVFDEKDISVKEMVICFVIANITSNLVTWIKLLNISLIHSMITITLILYNSKKTKQTWTTEKTLVKFFKSRNKPENKNVMYWSLPVLWYDSWIFFPSPYTSCSNVGAGSRNHSIWVKGWTVLWGK